MTDFTPQTIKQNRGPVVEFDGRLISDMSTYQDGKRTWVENALWETPSGKWVLEIRQCSDAKGERDFAEARIFDQADEMERRIAVMDALNWEFRAQTWANRKLGWTFKVRVD